MKQKIAHEQNIIGLIQQLQGAYSSSGVAPKVSNGERSYRFSIDGPLESTLCKTLGKIKTAASSAGLEKTASLQKKIRMMIELSRVYSADAVPVDAYIEYSQDPQKVESQYNEHNQAYANALHSYTNSGSDAQFIIESIEANAFHMLASQYPNSLFYTYYREQIRIANEIKHRIKNANVEITNALDQDKIHADRPKAFMEMYENTTKELKEHFGCIPLDTPVINGLAEELEAMKERIDKLKSKPVFMDAAGTIKNARTLLEKVKIFSVDLDNIEAYQKTYEDYRKEHQSYVDFIKEHSSLYAPDKQELNAIILEIENYFSGHDDFLKQRTSGNQQQSVEQLYQRFAQEYSNKNLSSLMSLLSDEWMSSSDGTTLMDLEETLGNSFSIFNEVKCTIDSLYISPAGANTYRVNYVVTIQGENYENDIKHLEKSSVSEEVTFIDGKPKISQTLSGKYWKTR